MKMNGEGIGTLGAALLVIAIIGSSLWVMNDYETNQILTEAEFEAQDNIYNISALQTITLESSGGWTSYNIFGDKVVYVYLNNIIRIYNFTSEQKFTIYDANSSTVVLWADIGEYGVSWIEDYNPLSSRNVRAYFWSNASIVTIKSFTPLDAYPYAVAITGDYTVYPMGDTIRKFNMDSWSDAEVVDFGMSNIQIGVMDGGDRNQVIVWYLSGGTTYSYLMLDIDDSSVTPITTQTMFQQYSVADVWGDEIAFSDYSGKKIKVLDTSDSTSTTIADLSGITYPIGYVAVHDGYLNYAYLNGSAYTMRFRDVGEGVDVFVGTIPAATTMTRVDSYGGRVIAGEASYFCTYTYSVSDTDVADEDENATAGNDDEQTTAEAAQEWISNNWYIVVGAVMGVVAVAYVAWKRFGETEYAERMSSFKQVNWSIVIAVGVIAAIGILLFL